MKETAPVAKNNAMNAKKVWPELYESRNVDRGGGGEGVSKELLLIVFALLGHGGYSR